MLLVATATWLQRHTYWGEGLPWGGNLLQWANERVLLLGLLLLGLSVLL